jgi:hypothetical protein
MNHSLLKTYLYTVIITAALNLVLGLFYVLTWDGVRVPRLFLVSIPEPVIFVLSIVLIINIWDKKSNTIVIMLPMIYVVVALPLLLYWMYLGIYGIDPLDFSYVPNIIVSLLSLLSYLFHIVFGSYLLLKRNI